MTKALFPALLLISMLSTAPAHAMPMDFEATLNGDQEVPSVITQASGTATLNLNASQDRLEIMIQLFGLDLDGAQTADPLDDIIGGHIHKAPAGVNGPVVFGILSPSSDFNNDLLIDAAAGTIFTAWDLSEGFITTLGAELPALFSEGLYFNFHTTGNPAGEIRGQIVRAAGPVPLPSTLFLLGLAMAALNLGYRHRT